MLNKGYITCQHTISNDFWPYVLSSFGCCSVTSMTYCPGSTHRVPCRSTFWSTWTWWSGQINMRKEKFECKSLHHQLVSVVGFLLFLNVSWANSWVRIPFIGDSWRPKLSDKSSTRSVVVGFSAWKLPDLKGIGQGVHAPRADSANSCKVSLGHRMYIYMRLKGTFSLQNQTQGHLGI